MKNASSPANTQETVEACCIRFEKQWQSGLAPRIEDYVRHATEPDRSERLRALLALECDLLRQDGVVATPNLYLKRFPKDDKIVIQVFKEHATQQFDKASAASANQLAAATRTGVTPVEPESTGSMAMPKQLGRFEIRGMLGEGAFGCVYHAFDPKLQRDVALKVPKAGTLQKSLDRERFFREARAAAGLRHPNICAIHEVHDEIDPPFLVMDLIKGKSFDAYLRELKTPMPERQAAVIVYRLALALSAAHESGIIHRDLKPANIMVDMEREDVVLTDFGLARRLTPDESNLTQEGRVLGTPAYMSPEQARGESRSVTPSSDIYSLGVIFYELLTGVRPFKGQVREILGKVRNEQPPAPSQLRPDVDRNLEAICVKAMAKKAEDRYASMKELVQAVDVYLKAVPQAEPVQEGQPGSIANVLAALSADRKAEAEAAQKSWAQLGRLNLGITLLLGVLTLVGVGVLVLMVTRTSGPTTVNHVTVNFKNIDVSDWSLDYFLDREKIDPKKLQEPLELAVGEHELVIKRAELVLNRLVFRVGQDGDPREIDVPAVEPPKSSEIWSHKAYDDWHASLRGSFPALCSVAVSADGKMIVTVGYMESLKGYAVGLWDGDIPKKKHNEEWPRISNEQSNKATFAPTGRLAYWGFDGKRPMTGKPPSLLSVKEIDLNQPGSWKERRVLKDLTITSMTCLEVSRDGEKIVIGSKGGIAKQSVVVWDLVRQAEIFHYTEGDLGTFSPDGKFLFVSKDNQLLKYDLTDAKAATPKAYSGATRRITCLAGSPDGRWIAAAGDIQGGVAQIWDVSSGAILENPIKQGPKKLRQIVFSPDSRRLLTAATDGVVRISDVESGQEIFATPPQSSGIGCAAYFPDGRRVVFGTFDGTLAVWQVPR